MAKDEKTDRFRAVFEPEDIFDRFVKNANADSGEAPLAPPPARDDEPTGQVRRHHRGLRPAWDHEVTVKAPSTYDGEEEPSPEAPPPDTLDRTIARGQVPDSSDEHELDEEMMTAPRAAPLTTSSGQRVLLLTRVKRSSEFPGASEAAPVAPPTEDGQAVAPSPEAPQDDEPEAEPGERPTARPPALLRRDSSEGTDVEAAAWVSVVAPTPDRAAGLEALAALPGLGPIDTRGDITTVGEGADEGTIPARQLDQILSDMAVLLRYGHSGQVRERLEDLRRTYPEDLHMLRLLAEFHVEHGDDTSALEVLFALASGLFERRNLQGMRQALEQILVLAPNHSRAHRLLGLVE